ncbi:polysaccharide pyruvyl transferase family protein [Lolliginicoccus levis]|uniref:polysaccharide pyruvyl transferase family protein n=1 Tax=Lolliginicoccus levis TaxID=2919542 RepID=UPI00241EB8AB|nr:polysaccharide pyruvyl transferase family protein [Lolliginicoccus levis]
MPKPDMGQDVVYLIAPSGHPNYGDELIAAQWLRYLARRRPRSLVVLDCHTPGQASILLHGLHPNVMFVDTAWRLASEASKREPAQAEDFLAHVVAEPGRACLIVDGIELLARASSIHLLGGGYLNAMWPHHYNLLDIAKSAQQRSGARLYATGQGLMPAEDAGRIAGATRHFDVFDVRDQPSTRFNGTILTGDDAWLELPTAPTAGTAAEAARRGTVLCLQSDLTGSEDGAERLATLVRGLLDHWGTPGSDIAVIEAIPGTDRVVFDQLADRLGGALFVPFTEIWRNGFPASPGQTWISTRFHPHLIAAAAGASGIAISGQRGYYDTKHQSLIDLGSGWTLLHVDDDPQAVPRPTSGGFAASDVEMLARAKNDLADALYPPVPLRDRARALAPPLVKRGARRIVGRG